MYKRESTVTNKSDGATDASAVPKGAEGRQCINIQQMQNVLLIWLDNNIDENSDDYQNTIIQLGRAVNDTNTFTDVDQCFEFIETVVDKKACIIISGSLGQHFVPFVHNMSQVDSIFVFGDNRKHHELWTKDWAKIKGVFTDITRICEALKEAAHQCEQNAIAMSFVETNKKLDQLDPSFMYTQIIKEILLTIDFDQNHFQDYINYCRDVFSDNKKQTENIKLLEYQYHNKTPIYWYTCDMFLYPMLNRALRLMDGDIITRLGFFINDLHRQIEQLHQEQYAATTTADSFSVYRGQGLSTGDFEQMMKTKGGLISFNNFLSTSKDRDVSYAFAESNQANPDLFGILFVMKVDPSQLTSPFASIAGIGKFQEEEEVLFSMHSVFRIQDIKQMGENNRLYEVNLTLTADSDPELSRLTDYIRKESFPDSEGWYRLGMVLIKMGQFDKAEHIYQVSLNQTNDDEDKAPFYNQLGSIKKYQGKYQEALTLYEKSLDIYQKTLPLNHPRLVMSYNNIGNVHKSMGNYPKALSYYEKALEIRQQSLPLNHPDLASSYGNIGNLYDSIGNYPKALLSHEKALEIQQQSLPPNHPDLAMSYGNIGLVHHSTGNYPKALSSHEKALGIKQQSLPLNHPDLAMPYNNIGNVHQSMGNYSKALLSHEKALKIKQQSLPSNHPDLAMSYGNIGNVHETMGNYSKALSYFEKALEIQQQSLPPNHPDLAISYNNIGNVHKSLGNYPKALSYYEKALEIRKQSLPSNHPDLAASYNSIGLAHYIMDTYPKALSYFEKALEIRKQSLPPNHPDLTIPYNNIGLVHYSMRNYPKALLSHEKALKIKQQSLPPDHPDLAMSYGNIGLVHHSTGNYPKALLSLEKTLEIQQQSLPPNHPDLAISYNNIGDVHKSMSDYSKARTFYEHAIQIGEQSLPSNHPKLQMYRNNLRRVKNCIAISFVL
ncbi:unnamed protein product [Adineta steineri]|uniref:ADP ribosyltransferase domain-containing protein n=1 Tax=Adineta steineri TaxID=433720 RepID=A0A818LZC7_9BILA|nr:unnamed protein product [Adineta steineri]